METRVDENRVWLGIEMSVDLLQSSHAARKAMGRTGDHAQAVQLMGGYCHDWLLELLLCSLAPPTKAVNTLNADCVGWTSRIYEPRLNASP